MRSNRWQRNFNRPTRGVHRVRTFDPTQVINSSGSQNTQVEAEYQPNHNFDNLGLAPELVTNVATRGYRVLTPIQDQVIPLLMAGRDVVGMANTGTGKTAAFLLPLIHKVILERTQRVLVVAPTRELAVQIEQEFRLFARNTGLRSALCIGGVGLGGQIQSLKFNPNFVVGTPGRLKDLGQQRYLNFIIFNNVVLDEVDRMLDMGFIKDVTEIMTAVNPTRQSAFFSATIPTEVERVMHKFLRNPATVSVKSHETLANITQEVIPLAGRPKIEVLHQLLISAGFDKVLVFGRTKWGLDKLATELGKRGFRVVAIHGNKSQGQRQQALNQFKNNQVKVLLATDVASRGLDIDSVSHVVNYDLPESYEDYIHRIGRTGRADKKGTALTLV